MVTASNPVQPIDGKHDRKSDEDFFVKVDETDGTRARRIQEFERWLESVRGTGDSGLSADEIMEMTRGPFDDVESG